MNFLIMFKIKLHLELIFFGFTKIFELFFLLLLIRTPAIK